MLRYGKFICGVLFFLLLSHDSSLLAVLQDDSVADPSRILSSLLRDGHYPEAVAFFQKNIGNLPQDQSPYLQFARLCAEFKLLRQALIWIDKAIVLNPRLEEAHQLAVEVCLLERDIGCALHYWEKWKPVTLASLEVSADGKLDRNMIADELGLSLGDEICRKKLKEAQWRFAQHDYLDRVEYSLAPDRSFSSSRLTVEPVAHMGWGDPVTFLFNTFGGIFDHTLHLSYWNWKNTGISAHLPFRWKSDARWTGLEMNVPRMHARSIYGKFAYSWREERWLLSPGIASSPSFYLRRHEIFSSFLTPIRIPYLAFQFGLNYRWRLHSALTPENAGTRGSPEMETMRMYEDRSDIKTETARQVVWMYFMPTGTLFSWESAAGSRFSSDVQIHLQKGYSRISSHTNFSKYSLSWKNRWEHFSVKEKVSAIQIESHAGFLSRDGLAEDYFLIGTGKYADYLLRAHPLMEQGRFGVSPLLRQFALGNITMAQDFLSWRNLRVDMAAFADFLGASISYPGQSGSKTYLDTGAALEVRMHPRSPIRVSFAYGRDWRKREDVFYITTRLR
jgi:tetratricopeptide (TPR) repeat protein